MFKLTDLFGGSHAQNSTEIFSNFLLINNGKRVKPFEAPEVFQGKESHMQVMCILLE
jgi:hypothetical protein